MFSPLGKLHRWIGAIVAVFLIVLAVTGILLNHSEGLELDKRFVSNDWVLSHYQLDTLPTSDLIYTTDTQFISQYDSQLFVDAHAVVKTHNQLIGAVSLEEMTVLAFADSILLLTPTGEVIEWLYEEAGVPQQIQNIGQYHGEPVLQTRDGMWRSDFMLDKWEKISLPGVRWSTVGTMPAATLERIAAYGRGQGVSQQQLILDVHNGRILGFFGPWLLDLVALLIIGLAIITIWVWGQRILW